MPANSVLEKSSFQPSINPDAYTAATVSGAAVAVAGFRKAEIILDIGDMASGSTVAAEVEYSDDGGSTWANLLGDDDTTQVAFASKTAAGGHGNAIYRGLVYITELPLNTTHIRCVAVVAVAASDLAMHVRLSEPYTAPVVKDSVAQNSGGNAFYLIHGVGAR